MAPAEEFRFERKVAAADKMREGFFGLTENLGKPRSVEDELSGILQLDIPCYELC